MTSRGQAYVRELGRRDRKLRDLGKAILRHGQEPRANVARLVMIYDAQRIPIRAGGTHV